MRPRLTLRSCDRRTFVAGSLSLAAALAIPGSSPAAKSTPPAIVDLPPLRITLTDRGFEMPLRLAAGRYAVTVANAGNSPVSHYGLGRIPDHVTDADYDEWLSSADDTEALSFEECVFVGAPDWPPPAGQVTGVIELAAGRYVIFDPIGARGFLKVVVEGDLDPGVRTTSDLTVTATEMALSIPAAAGSREPIRWKIKNAGAFIHEVTIHRVSSGFTDAHLQTLLALSDGATPPAGIPEFDDIPIAAIGLLSDGQMSWLDVALPSGRYLALCSIPFGSGTPHAMDGMFHFFSVP